MNLVLITEDEVATGIPAEDPRAAHLLMTVGLRPGGTFHVGVENGLRGIAQVKECGSALRFTVTWEKEPQRRLPLTALVGLPRPQTARKVLHDLASLGVGEIRFFTPDKGDPAYAASSLWRDGEWREHARKGAEQACSALVPAVGVHASLAEALSGVPEGGLRVALDPYEAEGPLTAETRDAGAAVLAVGPERGWSDGERRALRAAGFTLLHLGDRVLRVEAAALVGGALMLSALSAWRAHRPLDG
ncbi:MAG: RsmE family RNA methyltransferase [Verrucomicrobiota bacterium]